MNIQNLPYDIHNLIFDNLENGKDIYNFKNTCKTFNNYVNNEIPLNSLIFKMKYKLIFNNCDINKHSIICKKMSSILEKFNVKKIEALGEDFNANFHQAMFEKETNEFEVGKVCEIVQDGYTFHDRLLRPGLVGVAKKQNENSRVSSLLGDFLKSNRVYLQSVRPGPNPAHVMQFF